MYFILSRNIIVFVWFCLPLCVGAVLILLNKLNTYLPASSTCHDVRHFPPLQQRVSGVGWLWPHRTSADKFNGQECRNNSPGITSTGHQASILRDLLVKFFMLFLCKLLIHNLSVYLSLHVQLGQRKTAELAIEQQQFS